MLAALGFVMLLPDTAAAAGRSRIKQLRPTWKGSTGLFNLATPETLRAGEFSLGLHHARLPGLTGQARIAHFPVSFTMGLRDYLEGFLSWQARMWPGSNPVGVLTESRVPGNSLNLSTPADFPSGPISGDLWAGLKLNLSSPSHGHPTRLALQPKVRVSTSGGFSTTFPELTPPGPGLGLDVLLSHRISALLRLTVNGGFLYSGDEPESTPGHQFDYGLGLDFPLGRDSVLVAELAGARFGGSRFDAPLELHLGMRFLSRRWFQLSAGYSLSLKQAAPVRLGAPDAGRHGWTAQLVIQRKINRPPVIRCRPERQTVKSGESAKIRVHAMDPDDDVLSIAWIASGGTVSLQGDSARFDSTGLDEGVYTISAELSDSENTSACEVEIRVERELRRGNDSVRHDSLDNRTVDVKNERFLAIPNGVEYSP